MAILGYNTIAGTVYNLSGGANPMISNIAVAASSGTATQINASVDPFSGTMSFLLGLFEYNSGSGNWDKLDEVQINSVAATGGSNPFTISGAISASIVAGRTYRITCLGNAGYNERYDYTGVWAEIASFDDYFASFATSSSLTPGQFTDYNEYQSTLWVDYTTGGGGGATAAPGTCDDTDQGIAPTVNITNNQFAAPGTCNDTDQGIAPTVNITNHQFAAPGTCDDTDQGIAPTVNITNHQFAAPGTCDDTDQGIAPTVNITNHQFAAPGTCDDTDQGIAPTVSIGNNTTVTVGTCDDTDQGVAPTINITYHQFAAPGTCSDIDTGIAPTVNITDNQFVSPGTCSDIDTGIAPTVSISDNVFVSPGVCDDTDQGIAPTVRIASYLLIGTLKKWNGNAWVPHSITRYRGQDISAHPLKAFDDTDSTWKKIKQL